MTISGERGREKEEGVKSKQKGKELEEPYDTVVVGPDGVGYVWTFRGMIYTSLFVVRHLHSPTAVKAGYRGSLLMLMKNCTYRR